MSFYMIMIIIQLNNFVAVSMDDSATLQMVVCRANPSCF